MDFVGDLMNESWLRAYLFPESGQMTLSVKEVRKVEVSFDGKEQEMHTVMSFQEIKAELTLAKINVIPIIKMFGNDVSKWIGKRITFYTTNQVMPHPLRKDEPCIRVYGSPDIHEELTCEWTPPKRRKLVQKLHPTGKFNAAMRKIRSGQVDGLRDRIDELTKSGDLTEEESRVLIAEINAKG